MEGTFKYHLFQPPCHGQEHLHLDLPVHPGINQLPEVGHPQLLWAELLYFNLLVMPISTIPCFTDKNDV